MGSAHGDYYDGGGGFEKKSGERPTPLREALLGVGRVAVECVSWWLGTAYRVSKGGKECLYVLNKGLFYLLLTREKKRHANFLKGFYRGHLGIIPTKEGEEQCGEEEILQ